MINVPTTMPVTIADGGSTMPLAGMSTPAAASTALRPVASNTPPATPIADAMHADDHRFADDRTEDLTLAGSDCAQQRHLAPALRDDDRERVVDDEHPDERARRAAKISSACGEESDRLVDVVLVLLRQFLPGEHLEGEVGTLRHRRLDVRLQLVLRDTVGSDGGDLVELVGCVRDALHLGNREQRRPKRPRGCRPSRTWRCPRCDMSSDPLA